MYTASLSPVHSSPPLAVAPLRLLDRVALHSGAALIRWVDSRERRSIERTDRLVGSYRAARLAAAADRARADRRGSLAFPPVR